MPFPIQDERLVNSWILTNVSLKPPSKEVVMERQSHRDAEISHVERLKNHKERKKEKEQARREWNIRRESKRLKEEEIMNAGALFEAVGL